MTTDNFCILHFTLSFISFYRACEHGQLHVVKYLVLNARANVEFKCHSGDTAISIAQKFKRHHVIAFLNGFLSWNRKTESSTFMSRREAADVTNVPRLRVPSSSRLY